MRTGGTGSRFIVAQVVVVTAHDIVEHVIAGICVLQFSMFLLVTDIAQTARIHETFWIDSWRVAQQLNKQRYALTTLQV